MEQQNTLPPKYWLIEDERDFIRELCEVSTALRVCPLRIAMRDSLDYISCPDGSRVPFQDLTLPPVVGVMASALDRAFYYGTGVAMPEGFLRNPEEIEAVQSESKASITAKDVARLAERLDKKTVIDKARFIAPAEYAKRIKKLREYEPSPNAGEPDTLCGFPIVFCRTLQATDARLLFGDFNQAYTIAVKRGIEYRPKEMCAMKWAGQPYIKESVVRLV